MSSSRPALDNTTRGVQQEKRFKVNIWSSLRKTCFYLFVFSLNFLGAGLRCFQLPLTFKFQFSWQLNVVYWGCQIVAHQLNPSHCLFMYSPWAKNDFIFLNNHKNQNKNNFLCFFMWNSNFSIHKVALEHNHACSVMYWLWVYFYTNIAELSNYNRDL